MNAAAPRDCARMLVACPDKPGIVAALSQFLFERGANIVEFDQHTTRDEAGVFFLRLEFELPELEARLSGLTNAWSQLAARFQMGWRLTPVEQRQRLTIFVSREDHCLQELLWRWRSGDLPADIVQIVSNHPDLRQSVEAYGIPFHHVPVTRETRQSSELRQLELLGDRTDVVVLARYMQILSGTFCGRFPNRIINIHHSFLPAFVGANPYAQAHIRGVKLIGATAHYVTTDLDAGPIIEQDVQRVGHRDELDDLKRIGREVERSVLARAVKWHLEDRVLVHGNRTVVFR